MDSVVKPRNDGFVRQYVIPAKAGIQLARVDPAIKSRDDEIAHRGMT